MLSTLACALFSASIFARTNAANNLITNPFKDGTTAPTSSNENSIVNGGTRIYDLDDLKQFRDNVNNGTDYSGQTINLSADINLNNENWTPIGYDGDVFRGTFNGNGYIIANVNINLHNVPAGRYDKNGAVGFFGRVENATISTVMLYNVSVTVTDDSCLSSYIGTLVGSVEGSSNIRYSMVINATVTATENGNYGWLAQGRTSVSGFIGGTYTQNDTRPMIVGFKTLT